MSFSFSQSQEGWDPLPSNRVLRREIILGPGGDRMGVGGPDAYEDLQQGVENLTKALGPFPCGSCRLRRLKEQGSGKDSRGHVARHTWLTETALKPTNLL